MQYAYSWKILSWKESTDLLFKLQKRLFKSVYVLDKRKSLILQKLILQSNCARLLAIREVTQLSFEKRISGVDGKTSLTFLERFELNEHLKSNWNNWEVQSLKKVLLAQDKDKNTPISTKIPTISDRAWLSLVKYSLEPVHEALFHPSNYGFRSGRLIYEVQSALLLNLSKDSFGEQKRILKVDLTKSFSSFNRSYLVQKIRAPRSVKLGIFRLFEKGFDLQFPLINLAWSTFDSLISNILLDGVEAIHSCIHYGYVILFILKPFDDEKIVFRNLKMFISKSGLDLKKLSTEIILAYEGFDFLGWHFTYSYNNSGKLYCVPSFENYQIFVRRVKRIVNNSNYGSAIKASKLYPIIKEWKLYHKYSNLIGSKYSLFFIKKRAFKSFNSESKQDFYSSKKLLDKCFSVSKFVDENFQDSKITSSPFYGHITFWVDLTFFSDLSKTPYSLGAHNCFCTHCGMRVR